MLYMNIKKMDFLFLNFTDYSITFDLHATTSINLSSVFFFLPYINLLEYVFFFYIFFFYVSNLIKTII
jgi:hypothetical protein